MDLKSSFKKIKGNYVHKTAIINWKKLIIGKDNIVGPHVIIGAEPQHPREKSNGVIKIGDNNIFREFSSVNLPTKLKKITHIGNNCYFMKSSVVDHDCYLEDEIVLSSKVILGGNIYLMKGANLGIGSIIHQGQVVGSYLMTGMGSIVTKKLILKPGYIYAGIPAKKIKKNLIGLKRNNVSTKIFNNENKKFLKLKKNW